MAAQILIVEDHLDSRELLRIQIEHLGYDVIEARSGEEGIEKALAESPDLIIMDIWLPGMNGIEAARALKQRPKTSGIPIIAHSACVKEDYEDEALRAGMVEFLTKPSPPKVFREALQRILSVYQRREKQHGKRLGIAPREITEKDKKGIE